MKPLCTCTYINYKHTDIFIFDISLINAGHCKCWCQSVQRCLFTVCCGFLAVLQWPLLVKWQLSCVSGSERAWRSSWRDWIRGQEGKDAGIYFYQITQTQFRKKAYKRTKLLNKQRSAQKIATHLFFFHSETWKYEINWCVWTVASAHPSSFLQGPDGPPGKLGFPGPQVKLLRYLSDFPLLPLMYFFGAYVPPEEWDVSII